MGDFEMEIFLLPVANAISLMKLALSWREPAAAGLTRAAVDARRARAVEGIIVGSD
jgi:hypothetical protein